MNRREFLALMSVLAQGCRTAAQETPHGRAARKPNVVFILADDLGWSDLGCYGSTLHETPNLDALARDGIRFTQAYAAAPVCSPTRASILTGKYPARLHLTNFLKGVLSPETSPVLTAPYVDQLDLSEVTIAEALKTAGYKTAHIGKWHLGKEPYSPDHQGFDLWAGKGDGVRSYFWPGWKSSVDLEGDYDGQYIAEKLAREAAAFIEANRDVPFYLNLCHFSVHIPIQAPKDKVAKYQAKIAAHPPAPGAQSNPHYAAMVECLDDSVGIVLDAVRRAGIADNTIVVFFSDNGGLSVHEGDLTPATTNAPLRAGKGYLYEGGIREPLIVRWPERVRPDTRCDAPVTSVDFLPTFCALAGTDPAAAGARDLDGIDVSALLDAPETNLHRTDLFWHYPHFANQGGLPSSAIRSGDYKLIEFHEMGNIELYNLKDDPGEQHDLAKDHPDIAERMYAALKAWREKVNATMPPKNPHYIAPKS